jgi:hypothetical protein
MSMRSGHNTNFVTQMRAEAKKIMPPQFLDCLGNMQPSFTPIYDFSSPQFVFGGVALVGVAASSVRPHGFWHGKSRR